MTDRRTILDFTEGRVHRAGDPGFEERWAAHQARAREQVTSYQGIPLAAVKAHEKARRKRDRRRRIRRWLG